MSTATVNKGQLIREYLEAVRVGDKERERAVARRMPLPPSLAKSVLRDMGKEFLMTHFNVSEANESFGEGWMDEYAGESLFR